MFEQLSIESKSDNINEAIKLVNEMEANMGGTEILKPIKEVLASKNIIINGKTFQKSLFLLTDGSVSNTN